MNWRRRSSRPRPRSAWRSLGEGVTVLVVAAVVIAAAQRAGLWPKGMGVDTGRFTAIDGDSLRKGEADYRLHAIDAPELAQMCTRADGRAYPCGREARQQLARLIGAGPLTCDVLETDRYQRKVTECRAGTLNVNDAMVRSGWAVAYRRHGHGYAAAEAEAKAARRGLWQGRFETPENWRNANRGRLNRSGLLGGMDADD